MSELIQNVEKRWEAGEWIVLVTRQREITLRKPDLRGEYHSGKETVTENFTAYRGGDEERAARIATAWWGPNRGVPA